MRRRNFLVGLGAAVLGGRAGWASMPLVTPQQVAQELQYRAEQGITSDNVSLRSLQLEFVPMIKVLAPQDTTEALKSPVHIELSFSTTGDAHVIPATFRAFYGFLRMDITNQVKQNATLNEHGLIVENAEVPSGSHRLYVQISDDRGRMAERELRFRVE